MKDSKWEPSDIADTEWIGGSAPTFDLNAERNLYIRTKDKKLGADPGDFTLKGFICEYKKRGYLYALNNLCGFLILRLSVCEDSTWMFDIENQRCLKVFSEEKTYKNAKDYCETESTFYSNSTLASLVPSNGTKLEGIRYIYLYSSELRKISYTECPIKNFPLLLPNFFLGHSV